MPTPISESRIRLLQGVSIFGAIGDMPLRFLLERTHTIEVAAGDYFYREGEAMDSMYVLESGSVEGFRNWHGRDVFLVRFQAGESFGEISFMDLSPRLMSVRAEVPCVAIELSHGALYSLFEHDLEQFAVIQMNISREVCRWLRIAAEQLFRARVGEPIDGDATRRTA